MGSGYTNPIWPQKCFNGYHSWKFGWYADHHKYYSPTVANGQLVKLATFVHYDTAANDEKVIINVSDKLFLLYNIAALFNAGTEHKKNQVTITEPTVKGTNSLAGLSAGDTYQVADFDGSGNTLVIEACYAKNGSKGADVMVMSIALNKSMCGSPLTAAPAPVPTFGVIGPVPNGNNDRETSGALEFLRRLIRFLVSLRFRWN